MNIYIHKNDQQIGPYSETQIAEAVSSGQISLEDLAWKEGLTEWVRLGELMKIPPTRPQLPKIPPVEHAGGGNTFPSHPSFNNAKASGADWASVVAGVASKHPEVLNYTLSSEEDHIKAVEAKNQVRRDIDSLDVSLKWKERFRLIEQIGWDNGMFKNYWNFRSLSFSQRLTLAFNIWAFLFGIFYYFAKGLWLKGIFLVGIAVILTNLDAPPVFGFLIVGYCGGFANYDFYLLKVQGKQLY